MPKLPDTVVGARVLGSRMLAVRKRANPEGRMPLMDHIRELRARVVKALLAIVLGTAIGLIPWVFNRLWSFMEKPYQKALAQICSSPTHASQCSGIGFRLIVNGIFDSFTLRIEVAFIASLVVTSPIWLYQIWAFIAPGLYAREKRWAYIFVGAAVPLFAIGSVLAYLVMGRGLGFLLSLAPAGVTVLPSISTYLGYFMAMVLGFGLTFELPLVLVLLNFAHVLTHDRFRKWRRVMIFMVFVFAGMAVPSPDPLTMLLLAAPCVILVEIAEVIVWTHDRRLARRPSPYAGLRDDELSPLDNPLDDLSDLDDLNRLSEGDI
jgi:sec-independent protein translocase protein TatC